MALAPRARAQDFETRLVARADTLLIAGRVFSAESLYYDAVRYEPHNPAARLALGRYLAARGAYRVGAVLMEEARYFGADPAVVARDIAPVYARIGKYAALAALPESPLPYPERARADWLSGHPPDIVGPDSARMPYAVTDSHLLGEVTIQIGGDSLTAAIDGRAHGLVLDPAWERRREVRLFRQPGGRDPAATVGVALAVRLGEYTLTNVPTRFEAQPSAARAVIGLDLLGRLAPTFDALTGRMTLRRSGEVKTDGWGFHIPTLITATGLDVVKTTTIFPIGHPDIQRYLRSARWTLNPWRGEIVVE